MPDWREEVEDRLRGAGLDGGTERDVADELAAHLQDRYDELRGRGLTEEAARMQALAELGDDDQLALRVRRTVQARPEPLPLGAPTPGGRLLDLWSDLRYGLRTLARAPLYAAIVVAVIGFGIGANTVIFTALNAVLLRPPSGVADPDALAVVYTSDYSGPRYGGSSYPDYESIRDAAGIFEAAAAHWANTFGVTGEDGWTAQVMGEVVSPNYFDVLGAEPAIGRFFGAEESGTGETSAVVVISHDLWQARFGGAGDAVGRTLLVKREPVTVIGVAARELSGSLRGVRTQLWFPVSAPRTVTGLDPEQRGNRGMAITGRMADGVTLDMVQTRLDVLASQLHRAYPEHWTDVNDRSRVFTAVPEVEARVPRMARGPILGFMALLMGAVLMVLLIACTNVANLMLSRSAARRSEMGIRIALGASRGRIVRHLLAESLVLAALGGVAGVMLAVALTGLLQSTRLSLPITLVLDVALDVRVLAFASAITLLTGVLFGLAPALQASRAPSPMLKDDARSGTRLRMRNALVVFQVASSLVLLVGGGLFIRSLYAAQRIDTGFDIDDVVLARFSLDLEGYTDEESARFQEELLERASALPGAGAVALASNAPLSTGYSRTSVSVEGYQPQPGEDMEFLHNGVTPGYFRTMGVRLVMGRSFTPADGPDAPGAAIVSEAFAKRFWPGESPLGKRVSFRGSEGPFADVVGVAADAKYRTLIEEPQAYVYYPLAQRPAPYALMLARAEGDTDLLINELRAVVQAIAPRIPPPTMQTFHEHMALSMLPQRIAAALLTVLGVFAIGIAGVGLYGLVAFGVAQRAREFGLRMALGAAAGDVRRLVLGGALRLVLIGVACGLPVAVVVAFLVSGMLVVRPVDPFAFLGVPLLLAACALLAGYVPARRATRQDPATALRAD